MEDSTYFILTSNHFMQEKYFPHLINQIWKRKWCSISYATKNGKLFQTRSQCTMVLSIKNQFNRFQKHHIPRKYISSSKAIRVANYGYFQILKYYQHISSVFVRVLLFKFRVLSKQKYLYLYTVHPMIYRLWKMFPLWYFNWLFKAWDSISNITKLLIHSINMTKYF